MNKVDHKKRHAMQRIALASGSLLMAPDVLNAATGIDPWEKIRNAYLPQDKLINLNNAAVSPSPRIVQEKMISSYRYANEIPDVHMWEHLDEAMPQIKSKLALLADCKSSEIAINRNTTEGLCTAIYGMPVGSGDEILLSPLDYASMIAAWKYRCEREDAEIKWVTFDLMDSDEAIIDAYKNAITPKTKVMHLTHMMHWNGRVLPVKELCDLARKNGIVTVVDAAQSFAQIPLSFRTIGCDYLATSLHKWLCAPFGTGMLIIKENRIEETYPLLAPYDPSAKGIAKFDLSSLGTYNSASETAIETAINFHNKLGIKKKHARLKELSLYWTEQAKDIKAIRFLTPLDTQDLGGVVLFSIDGLDVEVIEKRLIEEHRIRTRWRKTDGVAGVRVSPQIYTSKSDLDKFVSSLRSLA